jgi:hypothetical protein
VKAQSGSESTKTKLLRQEDADRGFRAAMGSNMPRSLWVNGRIDPASSALSRAAAGLPP